MPKNSDRINPSDLVREMNKSLGDGVVKLGSDPSLVVKYLSTGVLPIDVLLSGGLPRGRSVEIYGSFSTLKSYVALRAIATTQRDGGTCALVDTEHAFDPEWLTVLGGDPEQLILQQPNTGEEAVLLSEVLLRNRIDLVVWDSVAATPTKQQMEKKPGEDNQPGSQARFMSAALRRLTAANKVTAFLWINQTRQNIGQVWGPSVVTPGGNALPFYASYRMQFARAGKITRDTQSFDTEKFVKSKETIKYKVRVTLEKSKLNRPHRESWLAFDLETGKVDEVAFMISQGLEDGLIENTGRGMFKLSSWPKASRGLVNFRRALEDSGRDMAWLRRNLLERDIRKNSGMKSVQRPKRKGVNTRRKL